MVNTTIEETDVLIIGAGPVGLVLANLLGLYGRSVMVLESRENLIDYPRAVGLDDESFRLIQTIGLAEEIAPLTGPNHIMRLVNARGKVILYNDPQVHRFGWARKNGFNQPLLDAQLAQGIGRFAHVQLRFGHTVEDVVEDAAGLTALALVSEGDVVVERQFRASYLVGCEGGKSPTRKRMGVAFEGLSPETRWLVVDVANDPLGTTNVWLGADRRRPYVSIGLPQAIRRWEFKLHDHESDELVTSAAWVQEALADHVPDPSSLEFIRWRVYTHHGRVAETFRRGRQLIAGDAAHLMPVWLGQGWNSGVRDAMNLGWKLASVLDGTAEDALLDTYTAERMAHATSMVRLSMRMGSIIKMENLVAVAVRDFIGGVINRIPRARDYFGEMRFRPLPRYERGVVVDQSTLEPGHASLKVTSTLIPFLQAVDKTSPVGTQFPQPMVRTSQGAMLLDQAIGHWWSLLTWMNDPTALLGVEGLADARRLGARLAVIVPEVQRVWTEQHMPRAVVVIGDETGELKKWLDTRAIGALLLRPDRFIAGACLAQEAPALLAAALSAMSATASTKSSTNKGEL